MKRRALWMAAVLLWAALVGAVGEAVGGEGVGGAVRVGVVLGVAAQFALVLPLLRLGPDRRVQAYAAAALGRLLVLGVAALVVVPRLGLDPAALLLSLAAVLFGSTLFEPVVLHARPKMNTEATQ